MPNFLEPTLFYLQDSYVQDHEEKEVFFGNMSSQEKAKHMAGQGRCVPERRPGGGGGSGELINPPPPFRRATMAERDFKNLRKSMTRFTANTSIPEEDLGEDGEVVLQVEEEGEEMAGLGGVTIGRVWCNMSICKIVGV